MDNERELKERILKLFEETDRQSEEQELTEESRQDILLQIHARGWAAKDCWSEVER